MSKNITKDLLKNFNTEYNSSKLNTAVRHALFNQDINDASKVMENGINLVDRFNIEIKTLPVTNQKHTGRCWIFSGLNTLREITAKNLSLANFEFSQNYTAFFDKLEKANFFMETVIELKDCSYDDRTLNFILANGVSDGGQWDMLTANIEKYGLVPKDVMVETFASSNTRTLNRIMNTRLRKFNSDIRKKNADIDKLKEQCQYDIYKMLCDCFGKPVDKFDFEYVDSKGKYHIDKNLTPKSFYDKYVGVDFTTMLSLINSPRKETPFYNRYTVKHLGSVVGKPVIHYNLPINELKELVIKQLKDKKVVWFGSDVADYGDRKKGLWANECYDYETMFDIDLSMSKEDRLYNCQSAMNHAMVITGVNLVNGKPTKWKIENSWGDDIANKGYFSCSDEWFDRYVFQAVVDKKYLNEKQAKGLKSKIKELAPWDPMGTLAD